MFYLFLQTQIGTYMSERFLSGVGVLHQFFGTGGGGRGSACDKKWTQSVLRFCKDEWSKRFQPNENGVNWVYNQGEI